MSGTLARLAAYLRGVRHVAPQLMAAAWDAHQRAKPGRKGEPERLDALMQCARLADYGQGLEGNAEIGAEIARRLEESPSFSLEAALDRAARDREIAGLFLTARARGTGRQDAYDQIGNIFGTTPDTVRKVIASTPIETFEAQFPEIDPDQIDTLLR